MEKPLYITFKGVLLPQNHHFGLVLMGCPMTCLGLQVWSYVLRLNVSPV